LQLEGKKLQKKTDVSYAKGLDIQNRSVESIQIIKRELINFIHKRIIMDVKVEVAVIEETMFYILKIDHVHLMKEEGRHKEALVQEKEERDIEVLAQDKEGIATLILLKDVVEALKLMNLIK